MAKLNKVLFRLATNLLVTYADSNLSTNTWIVDSRNTPLEQIDLIFNFNDFNIQYVSCH